jgi:methylmalonyl-CoA mutase cobalamin-binding subunit
MLSSEVVALVVERSPSVVCLGSVGEGALAHTRYLTKRLRAALPDAYLIVARWGMMLSPQEIEAFKKAGADEVSTSLVETRDQLSRTVAVPSADSQAAA